LSPKFLGRTDQLPHDRQGTTILLREKPDWFAERKNLSATGAAHFPELSRVVSQNTGRRGRLRNHLSAQVQLITESFHRPG
jgi:hypothetical protein